MARFDPWSVFAVDLRSLGLFRVALGAALLLDLLQRSADLSAHYTDLGLLPAALLPQVVGRGAFLSAHYWASGSVALVTALFILAAAAAVALMLGYKTRLATAISWYLVSSLQVRNPWISIVGYDHILRLLLFWSLFLPIGARFSLDARSASPVDRGSNELRGWPVAALLLQVAFIYWVTGLKKTGINWQDGTAVWYALHQDVYVTSVGVWLRDQSSAIGFATYATRALELFGPFLGFVPWRTGAFRILAIALFWSFHVGLATALSIGLFPLVSMIAWIPFLPSRVWGRAKAKRVPATTPRWVSAITAATLLYVAALLGLQVVGAGKLSFSLAAPARLLRVHQSWSMFTPEAPRREVWLVFDGELANGERQNLMSGQRIAAGTPEPLASSYLGIRWRLWIHSLAKAGPQMGPRVLAYHKTTARFLCERHDATGSAPGERLVGIEIIGIEDDVDRPGWIQRWHLASYRCESESSGR